MPAQADILSVPAALLIALPSGLIVSGVATWAVRLLSGLAAAGRTAGLALHAAPDGHARLDMDLHPGVRVYDLSHLPRFEDASGAVAPREPWIAAYQHAARDLSTLAPDHPVILSPNLHADCYAVCVEVARRNPALVRLVGWQHNDIAYDRRVLAHYEPALAGIAGVSDHIVSLLRATPAATRIASMPYGVEVPGRPPAREPISGGRGGGVGDGSSTGTVTPAGARAGGPRPIRLLYTGRLDHHQKRILALPHCSRALTEMGIDHELTIMGDGPAAADLAREIEAVTRAAAGITPSIHLTGPATPAQVRDALDLHDAFILPSRFEGLSVAMLEALAAGCVPIVARVASGALQAIDDGVNGLIAPVDPDADEQAVGQALARQVARLLESDTRAMSRAASATARDRFSIGVHVRAAAAFIDGAAATPPPAWPADRPVWFSDPGAAIPADARARVAAALTRLAGRRIAVHGTGLHTRTLLDALLAGPATVVAFTDDDRQRHGQTLAGVPIVAPAGAAATGATDALLSTHLHEDALWARREVYERQGLGVHRLYG